ncbi:MAG: SRPBCC domain-containing protein [Planctomycetota bacterium]
MEVINSPAEELTDEAIRARTGKAWEEWFQELDEFGGPARGRRAIGDYLYAECGVSSWWSSTIVVEYEAARGVLRRDGRPQGYMICVSKTIGVSVSQAFQAFAHASEMDRWFSKGTRQDFSVGGRYENGDGDNGVFKKIRLDKAIKLTWENEKQTPGSIVEVTFQSKGDRKCGVQVAHDRIARRDEADGLREGWGRALNALKSYLETDSEHEAQ